MADARRCDAQPGSLGHRSVETPDEDLVREAQGGSLAAFEGLALRHYPFCLRYAWRQLGDREDAEEAVQDAMLRAWRSIGRCREQSRFRAWLLAIVINRCRSYGARRRRRFLLLQRWREGQDTEPAEAPMAGRIDAEEELGRLLTTLTPALREAFVLRHVEELSYDEMAAVTGVRVSALKMRVKRATEALGNRLRSESLE